VNDAGFEKGCISGCPKAILVACPGLKDTNGEQKIHNPELHRLYKKVDQLSDEDQKALLVVLDSLVKRSRIRRVMTD